MTIQLAEAARIAECDATAALLDSGTIDIYSGSAPDPDAAATGTKLATFNFSATAFGAAVDDGTNADATANAIAATTGLDNGVAAYYRVNKSGGTVSVFQGSVSGSSGGGDMILGNTSIATSQAVTITSFIYRKREV